MARLIALEVAALLVLTPALAADTFNAQGVVNNVKDKENKLNITHGPVIGLMAGMTMDFAVVDPVLLNDVKVGSQVKFTLTKDSRGNLVITGIEPVSASAPNN